jgi:hypothetical protein
MVINDTTDRTGIVQALEDATGTQSVSSYSSAIKIRDINLAFDDYQNMVKRTAGSWQADDTRHTKYPNMTFDLTALQKDYTFTEDEQGNQIQDIYRVECKDVNGNWKVLKYVNEMTYHQAISQIDTETGIPEEYYLTANGVFLVTAPNYTQVDGIRMFFTRSPNYFTTSDTTQEPGIPNGHHKYLYLKPAYWYWMPKDTARANSFLQEVLRIEGEIKGEYADRMRDEDKVLTPTCVNPY